MENVLADERKEGIAGRCREQDLPPVEYFKAFRPYRKDSNAQQRSRAKANQGANLFVSPPQQAAQTASGKSHAKRGATSEQN